MYACVYCVKFLPLIIPCRLGRQICSSHAYRKTGSIFLPIKRELVSFPLLLKHALYFIPEALKQYSFNYMLIFYSPLHFWNQFSLKDNWWRDEDDCYYSHYPCFCCCWWCSKLSIDFWLGEFFMVLSTRMITFHSKGWSVMTQYRLVNQY